MDSDLSFGRWVKVRRVALKLTQAMLAKRIGYSIATIRKIESDDLQPSRQIIEKLAEGLELAPGERTDFIRRAQSDAATGRRRHLSTALRPQLSLQSTPHPSTRRPMPGRASAFHPAVSSPAFLTEEPLASTEQPIFVGRARELTELAATLETIRSGKGQIVFIIGDAGRGKTALVQEFVRRAEQGEPDLLAVSGHGNAQTGIGDPYLPFREVLGTLVSDIEAKWVAGLLSTQSARRLWEAMPITVPTLLEYAPDLIGPLVPVKVLQSYAAAHAPPDAAWVQRLAKHVKGDLSVHLEEKHLFVQYTAALKAIAARRPLLLILEDLHWIDAASSSLLFHLSREIADSPILIVGTYRPDELVGPGQERHPLLTIARELKRQHGDIWLDLGDLSIVEGRQFVDAYLDTQPNRLEENFRAAFFLHTAGHALFSVELLREMQERGDLRLDAKGYWIEGSTIDWQTLPVKVEGVIEKRIDRLEGGLQAILTVASVEGEVFTAEVVAHVQQWQERILVQRLSGELDRQYHLVTAEALNQVGRRRLSYYRFRHYLFRHYLYYRLDDPERAYLHEAIGNALESLYDIQAERVAVQLAYHFKQAGVTEKAVAYLVRAGEQANRLSANLEALRYYQQASTLVTSEEAYETILPRRARILLQLFRGKEAVNDYEQLLKRARQNEDRELELEFLLGLAHAYYLVALDDQETDSALKSRELYDIAQSLARDLGNKRRLISSLLAPRLLTHLWFEYRQQFSLQTQEALALSRELGDEELILQCKLAFFLSSSAQKIAEMEKGVVEELQARRDLVRLNDVYYALMLAHTSLGNFDRVTVCCDMGIEIAGKIGVPPVQYPTLKALALLGVGWYDAAWEALQQEIADDAHCFGRTYKELGIGIYLFELAAFAQAAAIFEQIVVQAEHLRRGWMRDWAHLMLARTLIRTVQTGETELRRASQALAQIDMNSQKLNGLMGFAPRVLATGAEILLLQNEVDAALQQVTEAVALATAQGYRPQLVAALEVKARVLLHLQSPNEALSISEIAQIITLEIDNMPMLWRVYATKAKALQELGKMHAAAQAWQSAAAIIQQLAGTITDRDLQQGFLSDSLIDSVIACAQKQDGNEERK